MSKIKEVKKQVLSKEKSEETLENELLLEDIKEDVKETVQDTKNDVIADENKNTNTEKSFKNEVATIFEEDVSENFDVKDSKLGLETETNENSNEYDTKLNKDGLQKYTVVITVISILLFIGLVVFSTVFGLMNRKSDKIVSGISINGIDISGLTYKQANEKISKMYADKIKQNISLKHNDYETSIIPEQIETKFGIKEAIDMAYGIGRSGKLLKDNYAIVNAYISKININPSFSYNEKVLTDFIQNTLPNLPDAVKQSSYSVDGNNLIVNKGTKGTVIKTHEFKKSILDNIISLKSETEVVQIPVEIKEPDKIDIEKIHSEIYKEAKDAYYTKEPFTVYPHVNGVDFGISIDEAKALVNNEQSEITIPLKTSIPNVTTNQIGIEAFPDLLATYSTTFSTSNRNRTTNIKLASNKINGVVLMPGEEFSYNTVVGQRTAAAGYKSAAVYVNGKVENGIGGGICQVSSTLYNTALRANLEIVKRSNHRFATGYVPLSTDATVSWGGPEFIFKNSRKYPIKIVSTVTGGRIKVDIYGCKEDVEYEVTIKSETIQIIPMKTEYRTNTTLPAGTTKTIQKGHAGYKSRAYRILKLNGQVVAKQLLSTDTYAQLPTIIEKN